jgi:hypothetical protein
LIPLPHVVVRVFGGASRARITEAVIDHVEYTFLGASGARIVNVTQQTASGFAWGSAVGLDAAVFLIRNVGLGVQVVYRNVDVPSQLEPFSGRPFALSAHRTRFAAGLRLRF